METMNVSTGANAIGHPMSIAIALAEMVLNNFFERFPGLRVAFLEGGPMWFLMALERLSRLRRAGVLKEDEYRRLVEPLRDDERGTTH